MQKMKPLDKPWSRKSFIAGVVWLFFNVFGAKLNEDHERWMKEFAGNAVFAYSNVILSWSLGIRCQGRGETVIRRCLEIEIKAVFVC